MKWRCLVENNCSNSGGVSVCAFKPKPWKSPYLHVLTGYRGLTWLAAGRCGAGLLEEATAAHSTSAEAEKKPATAGPGQVPKQEEARRKKRCRGRLQILVSPLRPHFSSLALRPISAVVGCLPPQPVCIWGQEAMSQRSTAAVPQSAGVPQPGASSTS